MLPYLLSHPLRVVGRVHLERAVVRPQIDRVCDACAAPFVDLGFTSVLVVGRCSLFVHLPSLPTLRRKL